MPFFEEANHILLLGFCLVRTVIFSVIILHFFNFHYNHMNKVFLWEYLAFCSKVCLKISTYDPMGGVLSVPKNI